MAKNSTGERKRENKTRTWAELQREKVECGNERGLAAFHFWLARWLGPISCSFSLSTIVWTTKNVFPCLQWMSECIVKSLYPLPMMKKQCTPYWIRAFLPSSLAGSNRGIYISLFFSLMGHSQGLFSVMIATFKPERERTSRSGLKKQNV